MRSKEPDAVTIFVLPPSEEVLEDRLRGRGTESEEELRARLKNALEENREKDDFNYVVINDDLHRATMGLYAIYEKESPVIRAMKRK